MPKAQNAQNRRHVVVEVPSRSSGAASGGPCGLAGGSVSHQESPLVLRGYQRAKRPYSCLNTTLGYLPQSALGARSAPCEKIRFTSSISKILKSSWLLRGPDLKTRFEACERAGGSKSTKNRRSQNPRWNGVLGSQNPRGRLWVAL